jgi:hypothetical protein
MRDEPRLPSRHQLDHIVPTVIHDPEEKLPALARWLRHTMASPTRFWGLVAGLVIAVTGLALASNGLSLGRSADPAWLRIEAAKTPSERVEFAHEFPKSQAEQWALLQAAGEFYTQGFMDLPSNRDAAIPTLKKALSLFDEVALKAPQDSPQAPAAALGGARTLEALNLLDKAIKQYEKVASTWKGTPEAAEALRLAEALRRQENVEFYRELYVYKPVEQTLAPGGQGGMTLPSGHPAVDALVPSPFSLPPPPPPKADTTGSKTEPDSSLLPPPPPLPAPKEKPPQPETPKGGLPDDPFAPKVELPKGETPKGELPSDPFAPKE